jgi:hypothetical protein
MTKTFAGLLTSCALLAAGSAGIAAPGQSYPGQPTQAKVWIQNHGKSEAVPMSLQEISVNTPLRVQLTGTPAVQVPSGVEARHARQTWQYSRVVVGPDQDPIVELNKSGAEGWETTGLQLSEPRGTAFVLKRPR